MAIPSTEASASSSESFTRSTQVMENSTIGPYRNVPLDLSNWVEALTLLTTNLSIVASVCLLLTFQCIVKANNDLLIVLIQCLAVVNLLFCIGEDMGIAYYAKDIRSNDFLCVFSSFFTTLSDMVSYCYITYIIIHVFCVDVFNSYWMDGTYAKITYHSIAWCVPVVITIAAFSTEALGEEKTQFGSWCWIDEDSLSNKERLLWMLFTKQIWEILIYVLSASLIIITIWLKKRNRRIMTQSHNRENYLSTANEELPILNSESTRNKPNYKIMVWMFFYFYITRIWGTTRNLVSIVGLADGSTVPGFLPYDEQFFIHAQSIGDAMQGTVNFLMFCYCDDIVWRQVREKLCCKKRNASVPILENNSGNATTQT